MIDERLKTYLDQHLSDKRRRHTEEVLRTALMMAERCGVERHQPESTAWEAGTKQVGANDSDRAQVRLREQIELAAWCHDMFRGRSAGELDELIDRYARDPRYQFGVDTGYKGNANLAHGKLAAAAMERDFSIADREVLEAVSYHTTGRAGMTLLDKIIYLADAVEPGRNYPGVEKLRRLAGLEEDGKALSDKTIDWEDALDRACLASLQGTAEHLKAQNIPVDEDTLAAIIWLQSVVK